MQHYDLVDELWPIGDDASLPTATQVNSSIFHFFSMISEQKMAGSLLEAILHFITHKEICEVSENPLGRVSVTFLIPTGYFGEDFRAIWPD